MMRRASVRDAGRCAIPSHAQRPASRQRELQEKESCERGERVSGVGHRLIEANGSTAFGKFDSRTRANSQEKLASL